MGLQSLFADWNLKLQPSLHTESSSAKAVASRRRAGKSTRHIQTKMLWLQERVGAKHLRVVKVATGEHHAKTVDKKPREFKKLKKVNEAMVTSDATIKNEPNGEVAMVKNESNDATLRWMHTIA